MAHNYLKRKDYGINNSKGNNSYQALWKKQKKKKRIKIILINEIKKYKICKNIKINNY